MEWGSLLYNSGYLEGIPVTGNAEQQAIVSSATINARGNFVPHTASSPFAAKGAWIGVGPGTSNALMSFDLAVGVAGLEQVIFPDLIIGANSRMMSWAYVPVAIPAGSRICGRLTGSASAVTAVTYLQLVQGGAMGLPAPGRVYVAGIQPVLGTYGTAVTINVGSQNATWTQVTSACPIDARAMMISLATSNLAPASQGCQLQVGVGAASSEQPVLDNLHFTGGGGGDQIGLGYPFWFPVQIPAGARIAARCEGNSTADVVQVAVYLLG